MKQMMKIIVFISIFNVIFCVNFEDCGSPDGVVNSITVSNCSPSDTYCSLTSGSTASIDVQFSSNVDSNSNTVKIWGIIGGVPVPFSITPSDACKWGLNCPVNKGSNQELKVTMPISPSYPKIQLQIKIEVTDESGANFFCRQFPAQIV